MAQKAQAPVKRNEPSVQASERDPRDEALLHPPETQDAAKPERAPAQNKPQTSLPIIEPAPQQEQESSAEEAAAESTEQWEDAFDEDTHEVEKPLESDLALQKETDEKPKKKRRWGCLVIILIFIALIAAGIAAMVWAMNDVIGNRSRTIEAKTIEIEKGSYLKSISETLEENGIIRSALLFQLYVKFQQEAGALQYGTFELSSDMTYDELIELLKTEQKRDTVRVTFPEGIPAVQFAQRMEEAGLCTAEEFLQVANEGDFSQFKFWNLRDENPNQFMKCEGYLFPETYEFYQNDDVYNMVAKIYGEFDKRFTD